MKSDRPITLHPEIDEQGHIRSLGVTVLPEEKLPKKTPGKGIIQLLDQQEQTTDKEFFADQSEKGGVSFMTRSLSTGSAEAGPTFITELEKNKLAESEASLDFDPEKVEQFDRDKKLHRSESIFDENGELQSWLQKYIPADKAILDAFTADLHLLYRSAVTAICDDSNQIEEEWKKHFGEENFKQQAEKIGNEKIRDALIYAALVLLSANLIEKYNTKCLYVSMILGHQTKLLEDCRAEFNKLKEKKDLEAIYKQLEADYIAIIKEPKKFYLIPSLTQRLKAAIGKDQEVKVEVIKPKSARPFDPKVSDNQSQARSQESSRPSTLTLSRSNSFSQKFKDGVNKVRKAFGQGFSRGARVRDDTCGAPSESNVLGRSQSVPSLPRSASFTNLSSDSPVQALQSHVVICSKLAAQSVKSVEAANPNSDQQVTMKPAQQPEVVASPDSSLPQSAAPQMQSITKPLDSKQQPQAAAPSSQDVPEATLSGAMQRGVVAGTGLGLASIVGFAALINMVPVIGNAISATMFLALGVGIGLGWITICAGAFGLAHLTTKTTKPITAPVVAQAEQTKAEQTQVPESQPRQPSPAAQPKALGSSRSRQLLSSHATHMTRAGLWGRVRNWLTVSKRSPVHITPRPKYN